MTRAAAMSPFRMFGRRARPAGDELDPWLDDPAPASAHATAAPAAAAGTGGSPPTWSAAPTGPATAAARPSLWTAQRPPQGEPAEPEPVTDPFGFAPVPPPRLRADDLSAARAPRSPVGEHVVAHRVWQPPAPGAGLPAPSGIGHTAPPVTDGARRPARRASDHATTGGTDHAVPPTGHATGRTPRTTAATGSAVPSTIDAANRQAAAPARAPDHTAPSTTGEADDAAPPTRHTASRTTPRSTGAGYATPPADCPPDRAPSTTDGTGDETDRTDQAAVPPDRIDPAEASALAGAFAADLLSWDEDDPARRGRALGTHLASTEGAALLGWTGTGRQRADLVLPGRVLPDGDRVHVDVRVRVVPYRRVDARTPGVPEPEPAEPLGGPAAAPAPAARGWRGLGARWVRLEVAVVRTGGRLVVDTGPVGDPSGPSPADLAGRLPGRSG